MFLPQVVRDELWSEPGADVQTFGAHQVPAQAAGNGDGNFEPGPQQNTADFREAVSCSDCSTDKTGM